MWYRSPAAPRGETSTQANEDILIQKVVDKFGDIAVDELIDDTIKDIAATSQTQLELDTLYAFRNWQYPYRNFMMQIADDDVAELKSWIIKKLENMWVFLIS